MQIIRRLLHAAAPALAGACLIACGSAAPLRERDAQSIAAALRQEIASGRFETRTIQSFYAARGYQPAWIGRRGLLLSARALVDQIKQSEEHGLDPGVYALREIESMLVSGGSRKEGAAWLAGLDLRLTETFLLYGSHLAHGRLRPDSIDQEWHAEVRQVDLAGALGRATDSGRLVEELESLAPSHPEYVLLQKAFDRYLEIERSGGWPRVSDGPSLKLGARGQRVRALRERLARSGDLESSKTASDRYDASLQEAVRRFQGRHGLEPDGSVGRMTLEELNVPVEKRLRQVRINMERWRWIPGELGEGRVIVNIPGFELQLVDRERPVLRMKIIAGRSYDPTPILSDDITYLVLNPTWTIPESIIKEEIAPIVQKDPGYLSGQGIRVFEHGDEDAKELDSSAVDWSRVASGERKLVLRQEPGPQNPLGRIKFVFPNRFHVYLHDTPGTHLFDASNRSLSHGCVRLEKPIDLAEHLLQGDPDWTRERIQEEIDTGKTKEVKLPRPVRVHLLYWTAWVAEDGSVQFRKDIYGLDARLNEALRVAPAATIASSVRIKPQS